MLKNLHCAAMGHQIDRKRVWHDGLSNRARCTACAKPLVRERDGWTLFSAEVHGESNRKPHPRTGQVA